MHKHFSQRTFDYWLKQNRKSFSHTPQLFLRRRDYVEYSIQGINPAVRLSIKPVGFIEVWVYHQGTAWDILTDFDVHARRTSTGAYYCHLCDEGSRVLYHSMEDLWVDHSFKALLEWSQENPIDTNRLCITGIKDHYTSATLLPNDEIEARLDTTDNLFAVLPVVIHG